MVPASSAATQRVPATKCSLSSARKRLLELMQKVNFGRIQGLTVRNGEPVFDMPPRVVRMVKFAGENGPRPEAAHVDFVLKKEVDDLFAHLNSLDNGVIRSIEVKHGLPFSMEIEEAVQA